MTDAPFDDRTLLVDGMSMLVRCAKAARKMPVLSYHGQVTSTLVLFANSLTKRLRLAFGRLPSHVVVCWDGIPQQNWRLSYFPGYRKSRSYDGSHSDADLELAREFCAAAGLHQDHEPRFEGDDMVAAWWRTSRAVRPGTPIIIVSSDADLLQLCDVSTCMWSAGSDDVHDVYTSYTVRDMYGVPAERVALARALAGDASDEIPGIRGIGIVKAAQMAIQYEDPEHVFRYVSSQGVTDRWADQVALARKYYAIMELRNPAVRPDASWDREARFAQAAWHPWHHSGTMRAFLDAYGMQQMIRRLDAGRLPWTRQGGLSDDAGGVHQGAPD